MIFKHTLSFHLPVILFCKLFRFVCASKAAVKSSWANKEKNQSENRIWISKSVPGFFSPFFPFFFPLLSFQPNIPLTFKYTNTQAEGKQCSQVEKMLLCERMQRILTWGGKHSLKLFLISSQDSVWNSGGIFFMSVCIPSVLPIPQQDQPVEPFWALAQKTFAQCSGLLSSDTAPLRAKLRFPYVLIGCCFLLCRRDTQAGGCCSGAGSLSPTGPVPALLPPDLQKDYQRSFHSEETWQGWIWGRSLS